MSVATIAFAIDLERLRAIFGSKDILMLNDIVAEYSEHIREYEEMFSDGEPWLRSALEDLFEGQLRHPERASFYAWATEILCDHLGERLEDDDQVGWLDDLELGTGLEDSGPPLPIPPDPDTPLIGYLTAQRVAAQYERLKDADLRHEDDESIAEAREIVRSWLRQATESGRSLVSLTN